MDHIRSSTNTAQFILSDQDQISSVFPHDRVAVILAFDEGYLQHSATAILSLLFHANPKRNYEIFILTDSMTAKNHSSALTGLARGKHNVAIRFIVMDPMAKRLKMDTWYKRDGFTTAAYYPLCIPTLFRNYPRVIFIDGDVTLTDDISPLHKITIPDGLLIAACRDFPSNQLDMERYFYDIDKMPDAMASIIRFTAPTVRSMPEVREIFNSGLVVYNLQSMDVDTIQEELYTTARAPRFEGFADQHVLNVVFRDRVYYLNDAWNFAPNYCWPELEEFRHNNFTEARRREIETIFPHAKVWHYIGEKPWKRAPVDTADRHYWHYAVQTPFFTLWRKRTLRTVESKIAHLWRKILLYHFLALVQSLVGMSGKVTQRMERAVISLSKELAFRTFLRSQQ